VYSPDRVLAPMIRVAPKGAADGMDAFRPATWDEAVQLIAGRIRTSIETSGPDSVVPYLYSSSAGVLAADGLTPQLFERLGCPEVTHKICAATVGAAWRQVYGSMLSADPFDLAHSKLIVVWGANPNASNTHLTPIITRAVKENGATRVVIDPRRTGVAKRAHLHLAIRPGTDAVLAYAVTNWLVANGRLAEDFIAAAEAWPLAAAAEECGVDAADIERFAELVATTSPAMLRLGWGLERNRNGGSGCVGAISLWALAGHFGRRGAGIVKSTGGATPIDLDRLWPEHVVRTPRRQLSMNDVGLALGGTLDGWPRTEVLFVQGANPAVTAMDQSAWLHELRREDLFTVVHDQVFTDTAAHADVILPATTHFEAADLANSYGSFSLLRVDPVIAPVGESRSNDAASAAIAVALGFPAAEFDPDPDRLAAMIRTDAVPTTASVPAARAGITTIQFVDTMPAFADGSQRARVHDAGSELPVPRHVSIPAGRLTLVTPSTNRTINSMFAEFDPPEAAVSMHADDAAARGIADGDVVRVFNELGEIELVARLDGVVRPGVVSIPKGLWRRHLTGGKTSNALIPRVVNDLAAGACFNDAQVEVANRDAVSTRS
jgi:anaerobic selenocysteine-containing dehydrogenase